MKIKMKRLFGIMLSLVLVLGLMPVNSLRAYADGEGEGEGGTATGSGTGTGTYSATLEADPAVNSNNLNLAISFYDDGGGNGTKLGTQLVTIYPEKGTRTGSDSGNIPSGAKSVKINVQTAGNLVDFENSSISINNKKIEDISGITNSLSLDINATATLAINIKVIPNNPGGGGSGQGSGDPSQGGGSQERTTLSFNISGDTDFIEEVSVSDGRETQRLQGTTGTVTINEAAEYTISIIPYFGGFKIKSATIDGSPCTIDEKTGIASLTVPKEDAYSISITKGEQSDDVTILWTYDPAERTGGWSDAYIDASTGTVEFVSATRGGNPVDLYYDTNNGGYIQCKLGDEVTLRFVPKAGYQLTSASLNGQTLEAQESQSTFKVTMGGNFHLAGAFSKTNPQVNVSGSSSVSGLSVSGTDAALTTGNVAIGVTGGETNPTDATILTAMGDDGDDFVSAVETVDITMTNVISKGGSGDYFSNAGNYWTNKMTDLSSAASFSLSVPNNLSEGETYSIVRNHNGTFEELDAIYNSTTGTLTFSSDKFSNYTIIKKKGNPINNSSNTDTSTKVPYADVAVKAGVVNDITSTDAVTTESNPFGAKIENNSDLTTLLSLTDEEVAQGVNVWLDIQDMSASVQETDKTLIQDTSGDYTVGLYFDINLFKKVGSNDATKVTETNGKVQASIVIPESLRKSGRTFEIIRVHDGVATDITGTYDENTHVFTFETDKFSTYALVYKDLTSSSDSSNNTQSTTPKTGDPNDIRVWYMLLLASLGGLGFLGLSKKKKVND